ncbi:MAG TPA: hypothetical protein VMF08_18725 [Candidatus Sulfotelmatobacter sp.]|nr:hypothetical protein [Candidatus Sulfotelmatobacter sp.]
MAKSIRMQEIEEQRANLTAPLPRGGSFWEHWFQNQAPSQKFSTTGPLDEHSIWEKAVKWEILATDGKKY